MNNKYPPGRPDQNSQEEILKQLRDGLCDDKTALHVSSRLLSQWRGYSHPLLGLLYYKKRAWQVAFRGVVPGPTLALLLSLIGNAVGWIYKKYANCTLVESSLRLLQFWGCGPKCANKLHRLLDFDNLAMIEKLKILLCVYLVTLLVVVALTYVLGYIAGRFSFGPEKVALSLNGLYHDYPYGRRYSSWSQFCAVKWLGMSVGKRNKRFRWFFGCFPIKLLLSDGGSIRLWCHWADHEWLTEVIELLIAYHHISMKGRLPIDRIDD